jgi:hypothetical protein
VSLLLYVVVCLQVLRLSRRVLPLGVATAIAALFAAHPVHVEVLAQAVNQSELIVAMISIAVVDRYIDIRAPGTPGWSDLVLMGFAYLFASLVKESGFILPLLVLSAELTVIADRRHSVASVAKVLGAAAVAAGLALAARVDAVGLTAMRVTASPLEGLGLFERLHLMLQIVPEWLRLFLWPQHLDVNYVPHGIAYHPQITAGDVASATLLALWAAAAIGCRRRAPVIAFGLLWTAAALLPVSNLVPSGLLLAERTLFLPSVGFLIVLGGIADVALRFRPHRSTREILVGLALSLGALGLIKSVNRLSLWNSRHFIVQGKING